MPAQSVSRPTRTATTEAWACPYWMNAAGSDRVRRLWCGAGPERGVLRAMREPDPKGAAACPARDKGRAAVLLDGRCLGGRVHLDLLRPEISCVASRPDLLRPSPNRPSATNVAWRTIPIIQSRGK